MNHMIFSAGKSSRGAAWCGVAAAAVMLAGCMITPTLVTPDEVRNRVQEDSAKMYAGQAPISGPVTLGFRAEDARMVSKGGDIAAPVYSMELLGDATMASTRIDGALVAVKAAKDFRIRIGDTMQATIASELCHLFDAQSGERLDT